MTVSAFPSSRPAFQVLLSKTEKSGSKSCRTFLHPLHTLDIVVSYATTTHNESLSTVIPTAASDPWTLPRAKKCPPDTFYTSLRTSASHSSPVSLSKKSVDRSRRTFLYPLYTLDIAFTFNSTTKLFAAPWAARRVRDSFAFSAAQKIMVSMPSSRHRPSCHRQLGFYFRIPNSSKKESTPLGWIPFCISCTL